MHVPSTAFLVSDTRGALGDECRWFDGYIYIKMYCASVICQLGRQTVLVYYQLGTGTL